MGIARTLVLIGALNWGFIGLFGLDVVGALFGGQHSILSRIIYTLVGISGVAMLFGALGNPNRTRS